MRLDHLRDFLEHVDITKRRRSGSGVGLISADAGFYCASEHVLEEAAASVRRPSRVRRVASTMSGCIVIFIASFL